MDDSTSLQLRPRVKSSLDFIMNAVESETAAAETLRAPDVVRVSTDFLSLAAAASAATSLPLTTAWLTDASPSPPRATARGRNPRTNASAGDSKRRGRECKVDGCDNYIINRGLCFRHGGGKKCSAEGCQSSAKGAGRCWRHGGSVKCSVDGCMRRGKSRGLCWAHGGGTKCSNDECNKVAVSNGSCWAHGGGKRCAYPGCRRAAYERTHNYCNRHYHQLKDGNEVLEV